MGSRTNIVRYAKSVLLQIGDLPICQEKLAQTIPKECARTGPTPGAEQSRWSVRPVNEDSDRWRNRDSRRNQLETETDATPAWLDDGTLSGGFTFDSRPDWVEQAERELETARMKWKAEEEPSQSAAELKLKQINQVINHSIKNAEDGALTVDEAEAERVRLALEALNQAQNQSLDEIQADFDDIDARLAAKAKADAAAATPASFDIDRSTLPAPSSSAPPGFSHPVNHAAPPAQDNQVILEAPPAKRVVDPFMNDGIFGTFGSFPSQPKPETQQLNPFDPWATNQNKNNMQNLSNAPSSHAHPDGTKALWDSQSRPQPLQSSNINQASQFIPAQSQSKPHANRSQESPHTPAQMNSNQPANAQPWASQPDAVAYRIAPQDFFRAFEQHAASAQSNEVPLPRNMPHPDHARNMPPHSSPPGFQQMMHQQAYQQAGAPVESDDPISKLVSRSRARKAGGLPTGYPMAGPMAGYGGMQQQPMQPNFSNVQSMNNLQMNQPLNQAMNQPKPQAHEATFSPFAGVPQASYNYSAPNSSFQMMNKQSNEPGMAMYHQSLSQHVPQQHSVPANQQHHIGHAMPQHQHQVPQFSQPFNGASPPLPQFFQNQAHHQPPRY